MDVLVCIEMMISIIRYGLGSCPSWIAHMAGCGFHDKTWDKPDDRQAGIELLSEALHVSFDEAELIVRAFAHGDYGI